MIRLWIACIFLAGALLHSSAAEKKIRILTTFLPAYSFASNVAGEHAIVENLLPGDVSLHDYQLAPGDLAKISRADLILINGLGMETFLDRAIRNTGAKTRERLVTITKGLERQLISEDAGHRHDAESGHRHDPHVWLDPVLAAHCVTNISHALQRADPQNAAVFARNSANYIRKLHVLNEDLAAQLAPVKDTAFITYHNAFRYFVRRYDLKLAGVVEPVPEIPPSTRELSALLRTIREKEVKALFAEPAGSSRLAERIAKDTGIRLGVLDPLEIGELTGDAYERGMRRNAAELLKGLQ